MRYIDIKESEYYYFMLKGLNSIIFSDNYSIDFELVDQAIGLDRYNMILILKSMIENYRLIIDNDMKENILTLVNHYRYDLLFENEETKEEIYNLLNDIIYIINNHKALLSEYNKFIDLESAIRGIWKPIQSDGTINMEFKKIKKYNENDFLVLCLLLGRVEPEGKKPVMEEFAQSKNIYMYSVNSIVGECPSILNNENSLEVIREMNDMLKGEIEKTDEIDKKILKKEYKFYSKNINKLYKQKVLI